MTPDPEEQPPCDCPPLEIEITISPAGIWVQELPEPLQSLITDIQNQNPQNN